MKPLHTAIVPVSRTNPADWFARHNGFAQEAQRGGIDILFLGDSLVERWFDHGLSIWNQHYASRRAAGFGIDGDRTQHVLWRIAHGELDGLQPKVVVLLIGTNNTGREKDTGKIRNTVPEAIEGVQAVVKALRVKLPDSKILLLAIFPRGTPDDPQRAQVAQVNAAIAGLDDGDRVKYLDLTPSFLEADGTLSVKIMPDLLHLNERGYQIWAEAMAPTLEEMMR